MKKIYALFMTLCLIISATAGPLAGTAKKSYPLYPQEVVKAELSLDASMQKAPAATQALQYDATTGALLRYYNETDQMEVNTDYIADGQVYIDVMAADNSDYLSLLLFVEGLEDGKIPAGTYPITSEPAYGTAYASQGYSATQGVIPCAYYPLVTEGGKLYISTPMYFMVSGSVTIEYVGEDLKVTVEAVNSNNLPINIVYEVGGKSEKVAVKTPLKYDATEGELDVTYGADAAATVTDKGTYGTLQVMAPDASNMLALLFFYPEGVADTETTIPAGTYTISSKQAAGNVLASTGVSSSGSVSYSFYANLSGGQLVTPLYFLLDGTVEVSKVDGYLKVEVNATNSNNVPIHIVYDATPAEEIEWEEIDLEITNLTTEVMEVEGKKYLQLNGRDDMNDADVALFLNDYADVDGDYVVNAESSYMTFGGMELTVIEGTMTQTTDAEKGAIYTGTVRASVEEEGETMYVEFALTMYAAPAIVIELTDAIVAINEDLGTLTFNVPTEEGGYYAELAGYTAPGVHEGPQICLFETPEAVAFANYVETFVADGVITLKGEFTSFMGAKFDVTISGKLPVEEPEVELPAASVRAWAYDLALAVEGEQYTFSYKATTAAKATLIFSDAEGVELSTKDLGLVEAGANTAVLAATELPAGKKVNWAVKLEAGAIAEFTELTDASKGIYNFYLPQGVAVDNNPESATFGTIYVAAATDGASDGGSDRADTQKRGIFIYDQELNELNPTSNVGIVPSNVTFGATSRQVMKRLVINPVTNEVAFAHNADPMAVWAVAAENVGGEAKNLIEGLGFTNVNSICFTEDGTLYVLESNGYPAPGSLYKVANGVVDTIFAGNTRFGNGDNALVSDNRGGVWICQNRGQLDTYNQLTHVNAAGEIDFEVNTATPNGFESKNTARGTIAYNPAEDILAMSLGTGSNIGASLYKVTYDETTGVPALTFIAATPSMGKNVDGLAFDYAGDLYGLSANKERLYKYAVPTENNVCTTPAAAKYAFEVGGATPVEMVGVVKRAVQNGEEVIVLTHEADGTAHIYQVANGEVVAEVSQEGVIARDPENAGDYLAISDIAVTEDGKLIATNYMQTQSGDDYVDAGLKRGETRIYIWNDLAGDPSILFTSKMSSNWFRSKQGLTMAVKGTSDNMEIFMTGIHATKAWARASSYRVIDGVYVEPEVNHNDHYYFYDINDAIALETTVGTQYELNASPLGEMNWILDAELINPTEIVEPETNNTEIATSVALTEDLGKKYNGASYVTVGEQVLMVAPYATPEGKLTGVEILDITGGLDAAQYVDQLFIDEAVEATAAATAVEVVEGDEATALLITLVADATIYSLEATLAKGGNWEVYEDEITNLVIDLDNLVLIGGPSTNFGVEVFLGLGEYNMSEDIFQLLPESSVAIQGQDATFVEGYATVDGIDQSAVAVVRCVWNNMNIELHLSMSAAPLEAIEIIVENAIVEIEKFIIFGDTYDYSLKMTGNWTDTTDNTTYPVLVEVPVYYPEATEPFEMTSTVTIGGMGDNDPWLGFGEGTLTISTVDNVVTAEGLIENAGLGFAAYVSISGTIVETGLENATVTVKPVKVIKNGQLIITKGAAEYNAQGATVK